MREHSPRYRRRLVSLAKMYDFPGDYTLGEHPKHYKEHPHLLNDIHTDISLKEVL